MKKCSIFLLLVSLYSVSFANQPAVKIELAKNSWLAINGKTNIISFKLIQYGDKLMGKSAMVLFSKVQNKTFLSQNKMAIKVNNFKSDNPMALRDFKKLIKSDIYPSIQVQLNHIESVPSSDEQNLKQNISVDITIASVTRQYNLATSTLNHNEFITIQGEKQLNIRDFGLEPPVEMLGLIKVSEWITIDFKLFCKLQFSKDSSMAVDGN